MKEETKKWIERAEKDLSAAKNSLNSGDFEWASFQSQQAVEKALKSLLIETTGKFPKIHDLVSLGKLSKIPNDLIDKLKELTLAYTYSRYPDIEEANLEEKSSIFLKISREVLEWVKKKL